LANLTRRPAKAFMTLAERAAAQVSIAAHKDGGSESRKDPLMSGSRHAVLIVDDRARPAVHETHASPTAST
jgi:hypothetical protein